jgi:hypothetical protein
VCPIFQFGTLAAPLERRVFDGELLAVGEDG